jgi:hypothetical protein
MRALVTTARNIRHSIKADGDESEIVTEIEAILTVMTREMEFKGSGIVQTEGLETLRFDMTIKAAKHLVSTIEQWVEHAEKERALLELKNE